MQRHAKDRLLLNSPQLLQGNINGLLLFPIIVFIKCLKHDLGSEFSQFEGLSDIFALCAMGCLFTRPTFIFFGVLVHFIEAKFIYFNLVKRRLTNNY